MGSFYFTDRYQEVCVQGISSDKAGLIQALYKSNSQNCRKYGVSIHLYADDTRLYIPFNSSKSSEAISLLESCIAEIREWMGRNFLKQNESKTEFILIGSKQQPSLVRCKVLRFGHDELKCVNDVQKCWSNIGYSTVNEKPCLSCLKRLLWTKVL